MRRVNDDIAKRIGGHSMFIVAAQAVAEQVTGRVTSGEIVTQIQLGGSGTDSLVRILHAQPASPVLGSCPTYSPLKSGYDRFFGSFGGSADYFNHGPDAPCR